MNTCPKCGQAIEDAFGIVQCPKCKTMLVADFDGNLKVSAESESIEVAADVLPDVPFSAPEANDWSFEAPVDPVVEPVVPDIAIETEEMPIKEMDVIDLGGPPAAANLNDPAGIQEINNFANSEVSRAREGILFYQLRISGMDSADLNTAVKDALEDSKLKLNLPEIFKNVRNGTIVITKLNAVKASVIVSRLKEFPLEIEWSQMSLINPEVKTDANP